MTTLYHLARALESLDEATLHFADAVRVGEFVSHHVWYLDRLDLLKRATANLREKMADKNNASGQELFPFAKGDAA